MQIERKTLDQLTENHITKLNSHSLLSSIDFLKLWECCGGTPVCWTLESENNFYLLPGVEFGKSKLLRFQALPDGLYTQVVTSQMEVDYNCIEQLLSKIADYGYAKVFITDYENKFREYNQYVVDELQTIVVQIPDNSWGPPDKTLQSELRKAEREQVQIELFDHDKHIDKFLTLMRDTEKRHMREQKYPDSFYIELSHLAKTDKRIIWFWCENEGFAVSSHINFTIHNMLLNWQVYYDKKYSNLKANQKMLVDLVRDYKTDEIEFLNMGASPPEADTLVNYKLKYGGSIYSYKLLSKKNLIGKLL